PALLADEGKLRDDRPARVIRNGRAGRVGLASDQQHVNRTRAAAAVTGRNISRDRRRLAQHCVDRALDDRPAGAGSQPLAVNDPHADRVARERTGKELVQRVFGLGDVEAVQVQLAIETVLAAAELAQDALGYARAAMR